jgi:2-keto-4-pentenoate hydratase/2-oxohepta-3-ene-1,7-dioic acid hydratase in catechol pathway
MKIQHEKTAYKIVAKNIKDYLSTEAPDQKQLEFLASKGLKKKGPVANMVDTLKFQMKKNPIKRKLRKQGSVKLWQKGGTNSKNRLSRIRQKSMNFKLPKIQKK